MDQTGAVWSDRVRFLAYAVSLLAESQEPGSLRTADYRIWLGVTLRAEEALRQISG